jgi:hypothetical protein
MEPSKELLNDLILGVCHLCDRTRTLARAGTDDPVLIVPVREALHLVAATLEALSERWYDEVPPALPEQASDPNEVDWLLGGELSDSRYERGDE